VCVEEGLIEASTLEIQRGVEQEPIPTQLRSGISWGEVILLEGDDYIGHAVNVAARLCDMAGEGGILVTQNVVSSLPLWASVLDTEEAHVRGLENPVPISRIGLKPMGPQSRPDPICGIPLDLAVAPESAVDRMGQSILFCSLSCKDTWERRPLPDTGGQGSMRVPLIGS
jgi:YHS domain-containing protein